MKINHILIAGIVLISGTLLSTTPHAVFADDGGQKDTIGQVTIVGNTGPQKPVDPENPDHTVTPKDPGLSNGGALSIDYVAKTYTFYTFGNKIELIDQKYGAKSVNVTDDETGVNKNVGNWIQVTDNRGTNSGWNLQVALETEFTNDTGEILTGVSVTFDDKTIKSNSDNTSPPPRASANSTVTPGGAAVDIMTAAPDSGMGTWVATYTKNNPRPYLFVPGASKKIANTAYSATLKWTLADAP